jgi:type IV pilus assembly protein PilE
MDVHRSCAPHRAYGFTLIELMVTVAIVAILAAVAYPNYMSYLQRSKIIDATTKLSDFRVKMEQWFQDNRTYLDAGGVACGIADPAKGPNDYFVVKCDPATATATSYVVTATGIAGTLVEKFQYSLTVNAGGTLKATDKVPAGWVAAANCWTMRKDGSCG